MFGFLAVILLLVQIYPVLGQTSSISDHVVINEVETNPPGDDSKLVAEWVELYNPTQNTIDISGWTLGATTGIKSVLKIPDGEKIPSGGFLVYTSGPLWFPDVSAIIQLKSKNGTVVDETPALTDTQDSSSTWQRKIDGLDTHSLTDWVFKLQTPGSSNGKLATTTTQESLSVTVSTDKTNYIFGDTIKISGQVSKKVFEPNLKYFPTKVNLVITGPSGYKNVISLYPDYDLTFKTEVKTDRVLGVTEGSFKLSAEYGGATSQAQYTLGEKTFVPPEAAVPPVISLSTDKPEYIPGQTAILNANVSKVIPLAGLKFKIFNSNSFQVYDGTLFPDTQGKFSVKFMVDPVTPVYGKYDVYATYDKVSVTTSYQVVKEIKEDKLISLNTDKSVYGLGDTVVITGRSNKVWVPSLNIEIMQTFLKAGGANVELPNTYVIKNFINLAGDGTFKYEFKIPKDKDRYGDYRVRVSEVIGTAEVNFKVVENPETYVAEQKGPLSIWTDKSTYNLGDSFIISGKAPEPKERKRVVIVGVTIAKEGGEQIVSKANQKVSRMPNQQPVVLSFTGIPDGNGNFKIKGNLYRNIFEKGTYVLKATYQNYTATASFDVVDSRETGSAFQIVAQTDKQVYGAGETVNLSGKVSATTAEGSFTIILTDPDGNKIRDAANLNNGIFGWSWTIPASPKTFGTYRLTVSSASQSTDLFFKVSKDPKSETPPVPLEIKTDKPIYRSLETLKVTGNAIVKFSGTEGNAPVNVRPEIVIKDSSNKQVYNTFVDISSGGDFQTSIVLSQGIFKSGDYKITAKYLDVRSQAVFKIEDQFASTSTRLYLIAATDKEKYLPADTVKLSGRISKLVYVFNDVDISVEKEDKSSTLSRYPELKDSASGFQTAKFDSSGAFTYEYKIPQDGALGNYLITAHTKFDKVTLKFEVVSELPHEEAEKPAPEATAPEIPSPPTTQTPEKTVLTKKLSNTVNRISDSFIPVDIAKKTVDNKTVSPKIFDALLRVNPGDESNVNIKVSFEDGTCVIGQDSSCLVKKSTRSTDSLYQVVKIGDSNFKVRYSGPDVRLEKFTILPEDPNGVMPDATWNVEIIKKGQVSRFYYTISYAG